MADQGAEGLLSPFLRARRMAAARPHLRGRILDFGCGAGALASHADPESYLGVDRDPEMIALARASHPRHRFATELDAAERFDTVVCLAVVEHVSDPAAFLRELAALLRPGGRIVLTTPHPSLDGLYELGVRARLFSSHAHEEHEELLDLARLRSVATEAGLDLELSRRFLLGANQLFVLKPAYSTT